MTLISERSKQIASRSLALLLSALSMKVRGAEISRGVFFPLFFSTDFFCFVKVTSIALRGARSGRSLSLFYRKMPALSRADRGPSIVMSNPLGKPRCGCCGRGGGGAKNKDKKNASVPLLCPCCASSAARPSSARLSQLRDARQRFLVAVEAMRELVEAKVRARFGVFKLPEGKPSLRFR